MKSSYRKKTLGVTLGIILLLITGYTLRVQAGMFSQLIYLPITQKPLPWKELGSGSASGGGISNDTGDSSYPSLTTSPDGTPYVAWQNCCTGGDLEIYVRAWNGSSWVEVGAGSASGGGISNDIGNSWNPDIAIAPDGTPYVVWWNHDPNNLSTGIYIRAWNGSSWAEVGPGSAIGGGISNSLEHSWLPSIAFSPDGTPYVAWQDDNTGKFEIYVRAWDGSSWVEVGTDSANNGGISNNYGDSESPSVAISSTGIPYIAWEDYTNGGTGEIYVRTWNGSNWAEVGTSSATGGGISNSIGGAEHAAIALAPNGTPFVVWQDWTPGNPQVYGRIWDGLNWAEVGQHSASDGGISNSNGTAGLPVIAIASNNTPYLAWSAGNTGKLSEIHVRAWNGSIWTEVGAGSAIDGGISNTAEQSDWPSIAVSSIGIPYVTWAEGFSGNREVYIRFWSGIN